MEKLSKIAIEGWNTIIERGKMWIERQKMWIEMGKMWIWRGKFFAEGSNAKIGMINVCMPAQQNLWVSLGSGKSPKA